MGFTVLSPTRRAHESDVVVAWRRYDAIIHLVTAADGAEGHYSLDSNEEGVRTETPELARDLDKKTCAVWNR